MFERIRDAARRKWEEYNTFSNALTDAKNTLHKARERQLTVDAATTIVTGIASTVQNTFSAPLGEHVSRCVHDVIDASEGTALNVIFEEKRGQTEVRYALRNADGCEINPLKAGGGGLCDVVAFALRASLMVSERPQKRRLLLLDEPFKFLHGVDNTQRAHDMLRQVCDMLDIQAVVVTQEPVSGDGVRNYNVTKPSSNSSVKEIV